MGFNIRMLAFIDVALSEGSIEISSTSMCLLGNQYLARGTSKIREKFGTHIAQEYFTQLGADVISIDLNGKDGALPLDLQEPLPESLGQFDIIINAGTTEHVIDQDACFQNIHNLCKTNGLMFHMVPLKGHWLQHAPYSYAETFFKDLANKSRYSIVDICIDDYVSKRMKRRFNIIFVCLRKEYDIPFGGLSMEDIQENKRWRKG